MDPSSSADQYPVHLGTWVNWSRGPVMGATLTCQKTMGEFLIASAALFVTFVASRLWKILCFSLHRFCSTKRKKHDPLYCQRQAAFKCSSSPEDGIELFFRLAWSNRSLPPSKLIPLLSMVAFALVCFAGFTVASISSASISTAVGSEVLIRSSNCGPLSQDSLLSNPEGFDATQPYHAERLANAANYAQQCYSTEKEGLLDCSRFVSRKLSPTKVETNATCPFDSGVCRHPNSSLRLDSGFINSHEDLGLNTPADRRVLWRNVLHCSPLITSGFTSQDDNNMTRYHYGSKISEGGAQDYIHAAASVASQYPVISYGSYSNYLLDPYWVRLKGKAVYRAASSFVPIDLLSREDADMYIFFLSGNGVYYSQQTDDDWYRIDPETLVYHVDGTTNTSRRQIPVHLPREPATPLGCTDQYQFCSTAFPGTDGCGPLASKRDAIAAVAPLFNSSYAHLSDHTTNTDTEARYVYFMENFFGGDRSVLATTLQLGPSSLYSQRHLYNGIQGPLAEDQWKLDVAHWWNISKAAMQGALLDMAYGPSDHATLRAQKNFTAPRLQKLCNSQKIQSTEYTSFSLFGLCFTFAVGSVITVVSYSLSHLSSLLSRHGRGKHAHQEWTMRVQDIEASRQSVEADSASATTCVEEVRRWQGGLNVDRVSGAMKRGTTW